MSLTLVSIMCNILSTLLKLTVSPVRLELTPSCVAPNHPRGLYYRGLAAHLTPQRRRRGGCRGDWDLCSSGFPHGRAPRTRADYVHAHAHTHTGTGCLVVQPSHCVCVLHQTADRAPDLTSVCRSETDKER